MQPVLRMRATRCMASLYNFRRRFSNGFFAFSRRACRHSGQIADMGFLWKMAFEAKSKIRYNNNIQRCHAVKYSYDAFSEMEK